MLPIDFQSVDATVHSSGIRHCNFAASVPDRPDYPESGPILRNFGSSAESVGASWFRERTHAVIERGCRTAPFRGSETARTRNLRSSGSSEAESVCSASTVAGSGWGASFPAVYSCNQARTSLSVRNLEMVRKYSSLSRSLCTKPIFSRKAWKSSAARSGRLRKPQSPLASAQHDVLCAKSFLLYGNISPFGPWIFRETDLQYGSRNGDRSALQASFRTLS